MHAITIRTEHDRAKVMNWLKGAAYGYRVEVRERKRTDDQNERFWAILGAVAKQANIGGRKFAPDQWKAIFMRTMGKQVDFLPDLNGEFFPVGFRSSQLSVREMSDLQTFIEAWAAEQGIDLGGPK
jgi:hypothetical protein